MLLETEIRQSEKGVIITPFTREWIPAVKEFNARLAAGGATADHLQFPENPTPEWLARMGESRLYQEFFLAVQARAVRGAFALKHQDFCVSGQIRSIAQFRQPLSEGVICRSLAIVGFRLLRAALKKQPLLYSLGIGGFADPFARLLSNAKWSLCGVPFLFKVIHPQRFLQRAPILRRSPVAAATAAMAALTGVGWLAIKASQARWFRNSGGEVNEVSEFLEFGPWADRLWEQSQARYEFAALRDRDNLRRLYPASSSRFIRIKVSRGATVVGWAVLLDTSMQGNKYFGDLRVATLVDCLASPQYESAVIASAVKLLEAREVDLIISNQGHCDWVRALKHAGFLQGPTNYIFAASPQLAASFKTFEGSRSRFHLNRGDGSGPVHL